MTTVTLNVPLEKSNFVLEAFAWKIHSMCVCVCSYKRWKCSNGCSSSWWSILVLQRLLCPFMPLGLHCLLYITGGGNRDKSQFVFPPIVHWGCMVAGVKSSSRPHRLKNQNKSTAQIHSFSYCSHCLFAPMQPADIKSGFNETFTARFIFFYFLTLSLNITLCCCLYLFPSFSCFLHIQPAFISRAESIQVYTATWWWVVVIDQS